MVQTIYEKMEELWEYIERGVLEEDKLLLDLFLILVSARRCGLVRDELDRLRLAFTTTIDAKLPGFSERNFEDPPSPTSVAM